MKILIDPQDKHFLSEHAWYLDNQGYITSKRFSHLYLHRLIMKPSKRQHIDHINGNKLDNRRLNLRVCNPRQNQHNQQKSRTATSHYKGVYFDRRRKTWISEVTAEPYRSTYIGSFSSEHIAALAYDLWAKDIYGEFARPNFIVVAHS